MSFKVVVTGASSGIGRAAAEEFGQRGCSVAVLARRLDALEDLVASLRKKYPQARFIAARCDVSNWEQMQAAVATVEKELGGLNVLVNNAGAFDYGALEKSTIEKLDEMIDVNVRGVMYATKAFLPLLKKSAAAGERAKIVNVSSISGLWGFSNMAVYTATKFAITGFSAAMRRELRATGVDVASIHPGPVRSKPHQEKLPKKWSQMMPAQVAKQIYDLAVSRHGRRISHPAFTLLNYLENVSPDIVDRVLRKIL